MSAPAIAVSVVVVVLIIMGIVGLIWGTPYEDHPDVR